MSKPAPPSLVQALLAASIAVAVFCGFMADLSLRQWSSLLGAIAFGGIVYCTIGTLHIIDRLALCLAVVLATVLGTSAVAQYLLIVADGPKPPNEVGLSLLLTARVMVLGLVLAWPRLVQPGAVFRR